MKLPWDNAENRACQAAVSTGGGTYARGLLATALREHRRKGDRERAIWLRRHVHYITGHLWKDSQLAQFAEPYNDGGSYCQ